MRKPAPSNVSTFGGEDQFSGSPMEQSHTYLIECFKGSYDELKFRVKHRDAWLKTHLIAQLAILALASGIDLKVVSSTQSLPIILSLALPASLVLLIFYLIEENTISSLSRYIAGLSKLEAELTQGTIIYNFDSSEVVTKFFKDTQSIRVLGQFVTFLLIPTLLFLSPQRSLNSLTIKEILIGVNSALFIVLLIIRAHINRQHEIDNRVVENKPNKTIQPTAEASAD